MKKRIVAIVLSIVFMVTMLPFNVFAEESELMNSLISTIEEQTGTDIEVVTGSDKVVSEPEPSETEGTSEETIPSEVPETVDSETVSEPAEEEKQEEIPETKTQTDETPESENGTKGGENDSVIPVESISFNITEKELIVGESFTITATVLPEDATDKTIIWTSSNEEIATVNNGTVTSVSEGKVTITAASSEGTVSAYCNVTVIASEDTYDIEWEINDGVLTISGTGPMEDYASGSDSPWYSRRSEVTKVVISDGITHIGARTFFNFTNATEFNIGEDVESIGDRAFQNCSLLEEIVLPESLLEIGNYVFYSCTCSYTFEGNAPQLGTLSIPSGSSISYYEDKIGFDSTDYSSYTLTSLHYGEWIIDTEPTCTESGQKSLTCTYCHETLTEVIPALGHDYNDGICNRCGDVQIIIQGNCGNSVQFVLYGSGKLEIIGEGPLRVYDSYRSIPWYNYRDYIKEVVISSGVTSLSSQYIFYGCSNMECIIIPESVSTIPAFAFEDCLSLQTINIPNSISIIRQGTFLNCASLTSIIIPDSVINISSEAFSSCKSLSNIVMSKNVTTIGNSAFAECESITSIIIPDNVTSIPDNVFFNCISLSYVNLTQNITSIGHSSFKNCSSLSSIIIPDGVIDIGESAFYGCSSLSSIDLPEGIMHISDNTFNGCTSLIKVYIPDSVICIGYNAFRDCLSMNNVYIPSSVTDIADRPFYGCNHKMIIYCEIEETLSGWNDNWNQYALYRESCLETYYGISRKEADYWSEIDKTHSVVEIPNYITVIPTEAFMECSTLISVTIPSSVTLIGNYAFAYCDNLNSLLIPDSVTEIGYYAFFQCVRLSSIYIPKDMTIINDGLFWGCKKLSTICLPESVISIGKYAFYDCSDLISISILGDVTSIGEYAFSGCTSLISFATSNKLTVISDYMLQSCTSLKTITIAEGVEKIGICAFLGCSSLTSIILPETLITISRGAFSNCKKLSYIFIPSSVTHISGERYYESPFYLCEPTTIVYCEASENQTDWGYYWNYYSYSKTLHTYYDISKSEADYWINLNKDKEEILIPETISIIPDYAFKGCTELSFVSVPDSITCIGMEAFYGCTNLKGIYIPSSVITIKSTSSNSPFYGCSSRMVIYCEAIEDQIEWGSSWNCYSSKRLKTYYSINRQEADYWINLDKNQEEVLIPETFSIIPDYAFKGCTELSYVSIPDSITWIGTEAFYGCIGLKGIYIPSSVTTIKGTSSNSPFYGCSPRMVIYCEATEEQDGWDYQWKYYDNSQMRPDLYAYYGIKRLEADFWIKLDPTQETIIVPDTITFVPVFASNEYSNVKTISLGDSVTYIDKYAFEYCYSLEEIVIGDSVTSIGDFAFSNCTNLQTLILGKGVTSIGKSAFNDCINIAKIELPNSISCIGEHAFSGCKNIQSIAIPDSISLVEQGTFSECTGLLYVIIPNSVHQISTYAFYNCTSMTDVYYIGTQSDRSRINISSMFSGNSNLVNAFWHYQSLYVPCITMYAKTNSSISVSWASVSNATSYDIYRKLNDDSWKKIKTINDTSCEITLFGGTNYYRIQAYNNSTNGVSPYSNIVSIVADYPFTDVKADAYYYNALMWAYQNNVIAGTSSETFSPNDKCTRGQLAVMIYRMFGKPSITGKTIPFTDVKSSDYFYKAVVWAYNEGIINGTSSTKFSPNSSITRQDLVVMLWRMQNKPKVSATNPFTDVTESMYSYKAIMWAYKIGVTSGMSATTFSPKDQCTRAQIAAFLYKYNKMFHVI